MEIWQDDFGEGAIFLTRVNQNNIGDLAYQ